MKHPILNSVSRALARLGAIVNPETMTDAQLSAHAKRCLLTPDGEILLKNLVEIVGLDATNGSLDVDEANYKNGEQDIVKYILGLITE